MWLSHHLLRTRMTNQNVLFLFLHRRVCLWKKGNCVLFGSKLWTPHLLCVFVALICPPWRLLRFSKQKALDRTYEITFSLLVTLIGRDTAQTTFNSFLSAAPGWASHIPHAFISRGLRIQVPLFVLLQCPTAVVILAARHRVAWWFQRYHTAVYSHAA